MTPIAITFLVLAALIIWGGLVVSVILLRRDVPQGEMEPELDPSPPQPTRSQPRRVPRADRRRR